MTKLELVERVAKQCRITKLLALSVLETLFEQLAQGVVKDSRAAVPGFGVFTVRHRKARTIQTPQTHRAMRLPKSRTVGFRASKELKARLAR